MKSLDEVKAAAEKLAPLDQENLLRFLVQRLPPADGKLPSPRQFSRKQIEEWVAEDEAAMERIRSKL